MSRLQRRAAQTVQMFGLLTFLLLLISCSGGGSQDSDNPSSKIPTLSGKNGAQMRTLTEEEAAQRAEEHIQRAVAALPEQPTLTLHDDSSMECLDPTDHGPRGRYEVGKSYWLDDLPSERNAEFVDVLYEHWKNNGFRILTDKRSTDDKFISVENNDDAFRMSVKESIEGDLSLGASSPCVWPNGFPPEDIG